MAETPLPPFLYGKLGQLVRGTGRRDVHGQNVPSGTSVDTRNKLIQNISIILEVAGCLESQLEQTGGSVRGISCHGAIGPASGREGTVEKVVRQVAKFLHI